MDREPYPVTLIRTRYGGTYEGGRWAAFGCDPEDVPRDAFGNDLVAASWWDFVVRFGRNGFRDASGDEVRVAVGATPDEALAALTALTRSSAPA
jgi:hypothetical protein